MSVFLVVWILGEIAGSLQDSGIIEFTALQGDIGLEIHIVFMVFLVLCYGLDSIIQKEVAKRLLKVWMLL